jgi:hypothetical protein
MVLTINNGTHETMFIKTFVSVFKLTPSSFTHTITLSHKSKFANKYFSCKAMVILDVSWASKMPYLIWSWFQFTIDVAHHQCKCIKSSMLHPQIKCCCHCNSFSHGRKNMAIHGLANMLRITLLASFSLFGKNNPNTLAKDWPL